MWGRKSLIEEYLDKYPDSSLREYNEYVKEEERKRHQEKVDSDNRHKEDKCERCGLSEWMGMKIPLELHHKDNNHYNNKLDNLMIVCSNCHMQLHNYNNN